MPKVRGLAARRPWVQWCLIAALAVGVGAAVADAIAGVEAQRDAWGRSVTVWVAVRDLAPGEPVAVAATDVPAAVRPAGAVDDPGGAVARRAIGRGEIVTALDLVADGVAPPGWLVAPVRESLPSGARVGEPVQVVSDGLVLAADAVVVDRFDDVTLVAVPAELAPLLPAASDTTAVALLRSP